jgi:hypothetical protein
MLTQLICCFVRSSIRSLAMFLLQEFQGVGDWEEKTVFGPLRFTLKQHQQSDTTHLETEHIIQVTVSGSKRHPFFLRL